VVNGILSMNFYPCDSHAEKSHRKIAT
jgi:hypothetical protein